VVELFLQICGGTYSSKFTSTLTCAKTNFKKSRKHQPSVKPLPTSKKHSPSTSHAKQKELEKLKNRGLTFHQIFLQLRKQLSSFFLLLFL
jgi:hypothetical protein